MSYLKYNGKMVTSNNKYVTYVPPGNHGQVIWDGFNDYISFAADPSVTGSKKMEFYIKIDANIPDTVALNADIFLFEQTQVDIFKAGLYVTGSGSSVSLEAITNTSAPFNDGAANLTAYKGQEILVEITKSTNSILSIKVNGTPQSLSAVQNVWSNFPKYQIGPKNYAASTVPTFLLRDLKLYTDPSTSNTLTHHWKGYPDGNLASAWVDQVGSINGTVFGSPNITP